MVKLQLSLNAPADELDAGAALGDVATMLRLLRRLQGDGPRKAASTPWRLRSLAVGSVSAEVEPELRDDELAPTAALRLVRGLQAAEESAVLPEHWTPADGQAVAKIARRLGSDAARGMTLRLVDDRGAEVAGVIVTSAAGRHLRKATTPTMQTIGSVVGTIGSATVRKRRRAGLWPERGGARVEVRFTEDDQELVGSSLGARVQISGRLHRNSRGQLLRVDMRRLETLDDDNPFLTSLRGRVPGITEGRGAVEHLRILRDSP